MVDALAGVLGGIIGGGNAVADIAKDDRKSLAEKLKMEAQAILNQAQQERGFRHEETMSDKRYSDQVGLLEVGSELRKGEAQSELDAKNDAGLFDKPVSVGPYDTLMHPKTGKEIGRGMEVSSKTAAKPADTIKVMSEVNDMLKQISMPKDKGGIGWKDGQEIPKIYLDRINDLLVSIGKPKLKRSDIEVPRKLWWGTTSKTSYTSDLPTDNNQKAAQNEDRFDPVKNDGRIRIDDATGKREKAVNGRWVPVE